MPPKVALPAGSLAATAVSASDDSSSGGSADEEDGGAVVEHAGFNLTDAVDGAEQDGEDEEGVADRVQGFLVGALKPEECVICGDSSKTKEWFSHQKLFSRKEGKYVSIPCGNLCMVHGCACEAWPLLTPEELASKIGKEDDTKVDFELVCKGAEAALTVLGARDESVSQGRSAGMTLERKLAFITSAEYKSKLGQTPGDPGCKAEKVSLKFMVGRAKSEIEGTIIEKTKVPSNVAYETVRIWYTVDRKFNTELLSAGQVLRKGQAADRFQSTVTAMIASRPKAAKGSSGSAPLYSALLKEAQDAEKERKLQNEQGSTMRDDAPKVVSKSSLLEEEDDFGNSKAEKVSRSTRGGRGAGGASAAGRKIGHRGKDVAPRRPKIGRGGGRAGVPAAVSIAASAFGDESAAGGLITPAKTRGSLSPSPSPGSAFASGASAVDLGDADLEDGHSKSIVQKTLFGYHPGRERNAVPCILFL